MNKENGNASSASLKSRNSRTDETGIFATRSTALLHASTEAIQRLDRRELVAIQTILRHGDQYGVWSTPPEWDTTTTATAKLNVDMRSRISSFLPAAHRQLYENASELRPVYISGTTLSDVGALPLDAARLLQLIDGAVLTLTRYLVLLRMGPAGIAGQRKSLDVTTVRILAYDYLPRVFAACVSAMFNDESLWVAPLDEIDAVPACGFVAYFSRDFFNSLPEYGKKQVMRELERMFILGAKGYWNDVPALQEKLAPVTTVAGEAAPRPAERRVDPHLPLPDDYVSAMGVRSLWLIQSLEPNLFPILTEMQAIWRATDDPALAPHQVEGRRMAKVNAYLRKYVWLDRASQPIVAPPFEIYFPRQSRRKKSVMHSDDNVSDIGDDQATQRIVWPPRNARQVFALANAVQLAHVFVVALPMAARRSEIVTLERACVHYAPDGLPYADGKTFKLVESHEGVLRDWVLPAVSVEAIEQQARLIGLLETLGSMRPDRSPSAVGESVKPVARHLWGQSGHGHADRTKRLVNLNGALAQYAKTLGMDPKPGGQNLRPHRLRKTIARLAALALTQAPKILMDVFGHKAIEMTLTYILTEKDLRAEIERVSRELRIMRAKEVVERMVAEEDGAAGARPNGGYGGPAAFAMQRAIDVQTEGLHQRGAEWGADTALELAEILTLQGKAWQYVRPGVICTKFPGTESGPCNKSKGAPEPARCQTHCRHRLEEDFLREDVDGAIGDSVVAYVEASAAGEELAQALWAGQIRAHLLRFEDIRQKWMDDPVVQRVLAEQEGVAG
jgi:hypothetical protein